jgi:streptogramin lyase
MRRTVPVFVAVALVSGAWSALAAAPPSVRLVGPRGAVAGAQWRATLVVRPAPRVAPRVVARRGRASVAVRVLRVAAGRYSVRASFPAAGRWLVSARVGRTRRALGAIAVASRPIRLESVLGIALHPDGRLLIADGDGRRVVRADLRTGRLTPFASAGLVAPTGLAVGRDGTVYVADRNARAVFRVRGGAVSRLVEYEDPLSVAVDSQGQLFVTGRVNTVVRVDPASGAATRYAGTGAEGTTGNGGPALSATLFAPHGIAVDPNDNVVVAEVTGVRRIDRSTSVIDVVAGNGARALCGERGRAREVCLTALRIAFEPDGDLWIADPENRRLWRVAGGEAQAYDVGFAPFDVLVESAATLLVADNENRRVLRFDTTTGAVTRVVG